MEPIQPANLGDSGRIVTLIESTHPDDQRLRDFLLGILDIRYQQETESHVANCERCCQRLVSFESQPTQDTLIDRLRNFDTSLLNDEPGPADCQSGTLPAGLSNHPRYEIIKLIGSGGMGQVYLAHHKAFDCEVAIKVIKSQLTHDANALKRFQKEIRATARLKHENIVCSIDAEIEHDLNMLVMEYVPGQKLSQYVRSQGPLPVRHACHLTRQVAKGLAHAADRGLSHRDIKPQNLMIVREQGLIKIMDFGLAKFASESISDDEESLTREGECFGTPDYMSPEQIRDTKSADIRSDIYSLGCTFYLMLTSVLPYPMAAIGQKLAAHLDQPAKPIDEIRPEVPRAVCEIVEKMMSKRPDQRHQHPSELVEILKPWCNRPSS